MDRWMSGSGWLVLKGTRFPGGFFFRGVGGWWGYSYNIVAFEELVGTL